MSARADASATGELLTVRLRRVFDASPARVFAAWTEPDLLVRWWGPGGFSSDWAELDLRPGGHYRIHMRAEEGGYEGVLAGTYVEVTPPERLVFRVTQHCNGAPEIFDATKMAPTTVTIALRDVGDGKTELELTHTGFVDAVPAQAHDGGWSSSFEKLAAVVQAA